MPGTPQAPKMLAADGDGAAGANRNFGIGLGRCFDLVRCGMTPAHVVIDAGCGWGRLGRHLIDYLEPGTRLINPRIMCTLTLTSAALLCPRVYSIVIANSTAT